MYVYMYMYMYMYMYIYIYILYERSCQEDLRQVQQKRIQRAKLSLADVLLLVDLCLDPRFVAQRGA